jgi:hypothetical protein
VENAWKRTLMRSFPVATLVLVGAGVAWAQQDNDGMKVLQSIDGSVKSGWGYLKTAAALIVGGGFLASGGRAMTKGDWTGGTVGIGFGALVLVAFFALGKTLGLN